jgi:S1-C subfamily serine protease
MRRLTIAALAAASLVPLQAMAAGAPTLWTWIGAEAFSMGAFLVDVQPGGPVDRAGLKAGDFIYRYDNKAVPSMAGLFELVHTTPPGKIVEVYFLRGDKELHVDLKVEALPGGQELEGMQPESFPLFADPKACTPDLRARAGRC